MAINEVEQVLTLFGLWRFWFLKEELTLISDIVHLLLIWTAKSFDSCQITAEIT